MLLWQVTNFFKTQMMKIVCARWDWENCTLFTQQQKKKQSWLYMNDKKIWSDGDDNKVRKYHNIERRIKGSSNPWWGWSMREGQKWRKISGKRTEAFSISRRRKCKPKVLAYFNHFSDSSIAFEYTHRILFYGKDKIHPLPRIAFILTRAKYTFLHQSWDGGKKLLYFSVFLIRARFP